MTFSIIFLEWFTPRALGQFFLFIALNCLTSPVFIANLCSQLIPETTKLAPHVPQNVHFKIK